MWQYDTDMGNIINLHLLADSTDTVGNHYLSFGYSFPQEEHLAKYTKVTWWNYMLDTLDRLWLKKDDYDESKEFYLELDLRAGNHDWWCRDSSLEKVADFEWISDTSYFYTWGKNRLRMMVESYDCDLSFGCNCPPDSMDGPYGYSVYVEGIGRTYTSVEFGWEYLRGAIIDGVEYGDIYRDTTAIHTDIVHHPSGIRLLPAYPNPFNGATVVRYILDRPRRLEAAVYDASGRRIKTLFKGTAKGGANRLIWNGKNDRGAAVSSGMYYIQVSSNRFLKTQKVIFIK